MKKLLNFHINNKDSFAKLVFGYFIILLVYRLYSGTYLAYTFGQPMKGPDLDYTFWISNCIGFPHYIIQHYWACLLVDIGLVALSIACFFSNKYRNIFCILLVLFFFIQRITVETYSCSHSKSMSAVFIALIPFCFRENKNFNLVSEFARYFLIYILVASAFYKFHNGALLEPTNFATVLINQHSDLATLNPSHISYKIVSILIAHPTMSAISYILLFISQAIFIIGLFTKKFDTILFICLMTFVITTYFIMRIYNFDILILALFLLYFNRLKINDYV